MRLDSNRSVPYQPFTEGWLQEGEVRGRPVVAQTLADVSLLVSDDQAGAVYRISYRP